MARNSNGTYTLPIAAFVPGGVIKSSDHNSNYSDIATAITQSLATTGVSTMTGPIKAASGTAAAPSMSFASSPTTGFYLSGADQIGWSAAGVSKATFAASGAVSLSGALSVGGALTVTGAATVGGAPVTTFAAATRTFFAQAAAPTGWTQVVTYTDYALRLVSGAGAGTAGTKNFSAIFSASITNLAQHNHTVTDPGHTHTYNMNNFAGNNGGGTQQYLTQSPSNTGSSTTGVTIDNSGTGATTAFDIKYLDIILCSKD
jgi:hypothetical protein